VKTVPGDGRLSLSREPDGKYGLIVLDAFSSDAIPLHLLTREAVRLYLERLEPRGLLAFHISSKHFELKPAIASLARDAGLFCVFEDDRPKDQAELAAGKVPSRWALMARRREDLGELMYDRRWLDGSGSAARVWTDDDSDLIGVIRWGGAGAGGAPSGPSFR
jgi:hypothetical protein